MNDPRDLIARLRVWRRSEFGQSPPGYMFEEAADLIESLSSRLAVAEELAGALEPFLVEDEDWMAKWPDDAKMSHHQQVTFGDFRRARSALTKYRETSRG